MKNKLLLLLAVFVFSASPAAEKTPRVLIIGIDGCRTDLLKAATVPNLNALAENGAFFENTQILGERATKNDTVSGPSWSSILTGVWADKHGVDNNSFKGKNYARYPHFFDRIKERQKEWTTLSITTWKPISDHIVSSADQNIFEDNTDKKAAELNQEEVKDERAAMTACKLLSETNPTAFFLYFGQVDVAGHSFGFDPAMASYKQALEKVDAHIGQVLKAVRARASADKEDWLILVCTDHGGRAKNHSNGHEIPDIRKVFIIASGAAAKIQRSEEPTFLVDLVPTALTHLGITINPEWQLDGRAIGLKSKP